MLSEIWKWTLLQIFPSPGPEKNGLKSGLEYYKSDNLQNLYSVN